MNNDLETLSDIINNLSPDISFEPTTDCERTLTDLGIDSLDNMSLFLEIQERFSMGEIPDADIDALTTVNLILEYLDQKLARAA